MNENENKTIQTTGRVLAVQASLEGKTGIKIQIVDGQTVRAYPPSSVVALAEIEEGDVVYLEYVQPKDTTGLVVLVEITRMKRETIFNWTAEEDESKPRRSLDTKKFAIRRKPDSE